jgi:Ca-activated chloride channel homolog
MHARLLGMTAVLSGLLGLNPAGQAGPPPAAQEEPVFSARSEIVVLQVMVENPRGGYVANLNADSFSIFEDGTPQTIAFFNRQDAPVTVGLLVDSSGSMRTVRDLVATAAGSFAAQSNPKDEIFAMTFADFVLGALPASEPFTSDGATLRRALFDALTARGRTALFDAVAQGLVYADAGTHDRKVLVIVSDGGDNASSVSFDDIVRRAQRSNAVIYTVVVRDPLEREANPRRLRQLAEQSGGEAFEPHDIEQVPAVLAHVARDIRNTYTLGYAPAPEKGPGLRRVRVGVSVPGGRSFRVRTREAYLVEKESAP